MGRTRPKGYIEHYRPKSDTEALIGAAQDVLEEYAEHLPLTIRQIFYALVGRQRIEKTEAAYQRLGIHLAAARRARVIPFEAIRDSGSAVVPMEHHRDADDFRRSVRRQAQDYRRDLLADQPLYVEIWAEAAGMLPQLARVAHAYSVQVFASGGYNSLTVKKEIADRICDIGKPAAIAHLGDYDPDGEDLFRVLQEDVTEFVRADRLAFDVNVIFHRIALTENQVEAFSLPTAPAKKNGRAKTWAGGTCQLEALAPDRIAAILTAWLDRTLDAQRLSNARLLERAEREDLTRELLPPPS